MNMRSLLALLTLPALLLIAFWLLAAASFDPNAQPVGYVAQPGITNFDISSGEEIAFRTDYDHTDWSGNLLAVPVSAYGVADNNSANWEGAVAIDRQNPTDSTGRKIFTRNGAVGVTFRWASLSTTQQGLINSNATTGQNILNYVRGDRSNEAPSGADYYARSSAMGAVIHSSPRYFDNGTDQVVYVGANDGMLHAFDASDLSTGQELWAYVPSMVINNLNKLVIDPYVLQYYVDGNQTIASVSISSAQKTILVGGLGAGGKGLYALDITDQTPASEAAAANMSLWEITNASIGFSNLGYTYGTPRVATVNTGIDAVIVGNGYGNNGNGKAALFVIDAATGTLIREIATTGADTGTVAAPNGLSSVRLLDSNSDGRVDIGYAGDLDGHLWKFDLSNASSSAWTASLLYTTSPAQAITSLPSARFHPNGGYMVLFATGRMLTTADTTDTSTYYAYGIWDGAPSSNTTLVSQTLTEQSYTATTPATRVRIATINAPNWASGGDRGWKTALPIAGERVTGDGAFVQGDRFSFTSTNPTIINTVKPDGENWLNELDYLTGGSPPSAVFDLNYDGIVDPLDLLTDSDSAAITSNLGRPVSKFLRSGLASQPILVRQAVLDNTLLTFNTDIIASAPSVIDRGVSGGHFDPDIYYGAGNSCKKNCPSDGSLDQVPGQQKHHHEYDDTYDVTGVNMMNASDPSLNLSNAITSTSTKFKVLIYNQYWSPAAQISVGGGSFVAINNYGGLSTSGFSLAAQPVYTRLNIGTLVYKFPLDAFSVKDWIGDGTSRVGLMPTQTGCVNKAPQKLGIDGIPHNGALTIQLIKDTTPTSSVVLNVTGKPQLGWRVQNADRAAYVLAEWTVFWHHPNGKCMMDSGWTSSPPQDTSASDPSTYSTPAAGSSDPQDGDFVAGGSVVSTTTTEDGDTTTVTTTYSDGVVLTVVTVENADGTITVTTTYTAADGTIISSQVSTTVQPGSSIGEGGEQINSYSYGRQSWREL